jgi:hypothetical protein
MRRAVASTTTGPDKAVTMPVEAEGVEEPDIGERDE